ncbi:MAG TPA: hypothetical protein VHN79_04940, partial [Lacunisphaera sp.]|nr:hypothetical protein [Lacunisphaera sp.]
LWLEICRNPGLTEDALADQMGLEAPVCAAALSGLLQQQRVTRDDAGRLSATSMVIPVGAEHGWEVAVFDHFQAVCAAIIAKLRQGQTQSGARDTTGGTTLTYDVTEDHPLAGRVLELMARVRSEANALWHEVEAHNAKRPISEKDLLQVTFYCGQALKSPKEPPA